MRKAPLTPLPRLGIERKGHELRKDSSIPDNVPQTMFGRYITDVEVDGKRVDLEVLDTSGLEDYDIHRARSYPGSHVILICFAIDSPDSLYNVLEKWISEVLQFNGRVPILLVGLKKDLRYDPKTIEELYKTSQKPVTPEQGEALRKEIGARKYLECSAKTNEGVREVFEQAARAACLVRVKGEKKDKKFPALRRLFGLDREVKRDLNPSYSSWVNTD